VTALDLGLFGFLARNAPAAFEDICEFTGIAPHKLRVLMLSLCTTELVYKRNDRYAISLVAEDLLVKDTPGNWTNTLLGWRRFQYPAFPELTTALRTGVNSALASYPGNGPTLYHRIAYDPEVEKSYHESIAPFTHLFLPALIEHAELGSVRHLLDVGGGDGTTAVQFSRQHPDARVTVFDFPSVAEHAARAVPADVVGRLAFCPGDFFTDPFPLDIDAVLFSHILEPFSAEQNVELLAKAHECLPPGGRLIVYGTTALDEEDGGPLAARLSLYLNVLVSGTGMAWPAKDYARWLTEVGCARVQSFTGLPYEHGLVVGIKD
jgi:SAM-dependent methyltransferase